jgi:N-acetylglucosaminyldiphosphoundecaprenol N-acetyl-beta-D-mannosaminyltransferase
MRPRIAVLGQPIDIVDRRAVTDLIHEWAISRTGKMVCFCNVHSIITACRDEQFAAILASSDLNCSDGAPVAWMLRRSGFSTQQRVSGPDVMGDYCAAAAKRHEPIFLLGSEPRTLGLLERRLVEHYPGLRISGAISPPFRLLTEDDNRRLVDAINASGAETVWVALGCPKQERWMAEQRPRIHAVMLGVGAAFDYHAGTLRRAPRWMQTIGLEWLFRLACEPRRLWRRYLVTNTLFIVGALRQFARSKKNPRQ